MLMMEYRVSHMLKVKHPLAKGTHMQPSSKQHICCAHIQDETPVHEIYNAMQARFENETKNYPSFIFIQNLSCWKKADVATTNDQKKKEP